MISLILWIMNHYCVDEYCFLIQELILTSNTPEVASDIRGERAKVVRTGSTDVDWLVVSIPLKNMKVSWDDYSPLWSLDKAPLSGSGPLLNSASNASYTVHVRLKASSINEKLHTQRIKRCCRKKGWEPPFVGPRLPMQRIWWNRDSRAATVTLPNQRIENHTKRGFPRVSPLAFGYLWIAFGYVEVS